MVKKKVCIKQYICTNLFLCFLVREMNSWPLMLILWYAGRRREELPLLSLWHTALSPRSCKKKKREKEKQDKNTNSKVAGRARHPGRSTFYAVLPVGGVKGQLPGLTAPPSSFQPPRPPDLLPSFLPSWAGDDALSSLLRCHWPPAPTVSSVPRGYCRDVTYSWQHHWASPPSPMGSITGLQRWGVGGVNHGGTVRRYKKPSLPVCPSPRPSRGH